MIKGRAAPPKCFFYVIIIKYWHMLPLKSEKDPYTLIELNSQCIRSWHLLTAYSYITSS